MLSTSFITIIQVHVVSDTYEGDFCRHCGAIAPKCVICFNDPEPDEELLLFDCCKTYAHEAHAKMWLKTYSKCPYCHISAPRLLRVKDTVKLSK